MSIAVLFPRYPASASVGDPSATRTVYISVILLAALGVALVALAVWLIRRTRPEPQLLAPLEEMDTRAWRKQDPAAQRRTLDASRPVGALPVRPEVAVPVLDSEFAAERPVVSFDDLVDGESDGASNVAETSEGEVDAAETAERAGDAAETVSGEPEDPETALVTTPEPIEKNPVSETNPDYEDVDGTPDNGVRSEGAADLSADDEHLLNDAESNEVGSELEDGNGLEDGSELEDGSDPEAIDDGSAAEVNDDQTAAGDLDVDSDRGSVEADDGLLPGPRST